MIIGSSYVQVFLARARRIVDGERDLQPVAGNAEPDRPHQGRKVCVRLIYQAFVHGTVHVCTIPGRRREFRMDIEDGRSIHGLSSISDWNKITSPYVFTSSWRTPSESRFSLMRRLASPSRQRESRRASFSRSSSPAFLKGFLLLAEVLSRAPG